MVIRIAATKVARPGPPMIGDLPTAFNTGTSGTLESDASTSFGTSSVVVSNKDFFSTSNFIITGDGVTFNNCRFRGQLVVNEVDACNLNDCDFDKGIAISSSRLVNVQRCRIVNFLPDDAIHITNDGTSFDNEDITIEDCYAYNSNANPGAHSDGVQVRGSLRLRFIHNYIHMGPPAFEHNAAFYLENIDPGGPNTDYVIEDNYFHSGYGHTLYLHNPGGPGVFQRNIIKPSVKTVGGDTEETDLSGRPFDSYQYEAAPVEMLDTEGNFLENGDPYDIHNPIVT